MSATSFLSSFKYAVRGLKRAFFTERNFFVQVICLFAVITAGLFFGISKFEWVALALSSALVLTAELMNTAIEVLSDLLKPRLSDHILWVKDFGAASVFVSALAAAVVGALVFGPRFYDFLK